MDVGEGGGRPVVAKRALWSGKGFVQLRTKHGRAKPVVGLLDSGGWNAGY